MLMFRQKSRFFFLFFAFFIFFLFIMGILLLPTNPLSSPFALLQETFAKNTMADSDSVPIIVIDAGHGGSDPGKIGVAGTLEKDINLKIALYLKEMLEAQNIKVIMTRNSDKDLSTDSSHFKLSDMKNRIALIKESCADLVISIHQNSYTTPDVWGAQCFYFTDSEKSKSLAALLQNQIIRSTGQTKKREIKSNNDYYLLKNSPVPTVIAECGFLSNPEEEQLLLQDTYQRKMAWAIHLGLCQHLKNDSL